MSPFALSAIKYGLLALLYLFIWRSLRRVAKDLRVAGPARGGGSAQTPVKAAAQPTTLLVHPPDGGRARTFKLAASMAIGRAAECEIRIDDTYASQQHARLFGKNGAWYVEDLGSTNGTLVNEQKLAAPAIVQPGDKIRVGTTVLELRR